MKPVHAHDVMRDRIFREKFPEPIPPLDELRQTEWSSLFEKLMRNRLLIGRFRYGKFGSPDKAKFDNVGSALDRLKRYQCDGNQEHLVDVANLMMVEFEHPSQRSVHWSPMDDGVHAKQR